MEHIGSTAVPGLISKPTSDILMEISEQADEKQVIEGLVKLDYHYIPKPENPPPHMMFAKGYTIPLKALKDSPFTSMCAVPAIGTRSGSGRWKIWTPLPDRNTGWPCNWADGILRPVMIRYTLVWRFHPKVVRMCSRENFSEGV